MKACVLLGINGGFGNVDCAMLPISAIDLKDAVVDFERPKTGVQRTVPLWAETVKALAEAMTVHRPTPVNDEAKVLALLSPGGRPMVRKVLSGSDAGQPEKIGRVDWLFKAFRKTLEDSDLYRPRIGFYTLRHTFRTWADEAGDQHAIHRVMGHAIPGMSGIYVEEISMARLRAIVDRVHDKLYASQ